MNKVGSLKGKRLRSPEQKNASNTPPTPPATASSALSMSNWRTSRQRPEPNAARQSQVGDVGASDEQNERSGAQQHQQRQAEVFDRLLAERDKSQRQAAIDMRVLLFQSSRDIGHLRLRPRQVNAGFQTRDHAE